MHSSAGDPAVSCRHNGAVTILPTACRSPNRVTSLTVPRRTAGATTNMWTGATDNGSLRPVTDFGHQATFIARRVSWSPDGKSIYAAVGKGEADIVLLTHLRP